MEAEAVLEAFHDSIGYLLALQQTASSMYFSHKEHKEFLALSSFFQLCQQTNLNEWLEQSYQYPGKEPVDPNLLTRAEKGDFSSSIVSSNEQAAFRNLFRMVRAGKIAEAYEYCLHVLQRPWLAIVIQPALEANNENKGLWKATLTSIACSGEKWQRAFYGALVGDLVSVQAVSEHPLDQLWACVNAQNLDAFAVDCCTFEGLYAQVCAQFMKKDWNGIQTSFERFVKSKDTLDLEMAIVALMGFNLAADPFWEHFISLWLASSDQTQIESTIHKLPYISLIKNSTLQQQVLAEVLFEECLSLDRTNIFRISTNCKKYCPLSFEPALQLMFQKVLSEEDLDSVLLYNLTHFTSFPLLSADRFALELTAALSRKFLISQNITLLKSLITSIDPKDLLKYENTLIRELACYMHLVRVLLVYDQWREELLKEPQVSESSQGFERILWERQHAHWKQEISTVASMAHQAYQAAISIGWLNPADLHYKNMLLLSEDQREDELEKARSIGISLMDSIMRNVCK